MLCLLDFVLICKSATIWFGIFVMYLTYIVIYYIPLLDRNQKSFINLKKVQNNFIFLIVIEAIQIKANLFTIISHYKLLKCGG